MSNWFCYIFGTIGVLTVVSSILVFVVGMSIAKDYEEHGHD